MEILGILLAIPFGFIASFAYAYFAEVSLAKHLADKVPISYRDYTLSQF
jgi:predicted outer membrane lipoprotein